MYSIKATKEVFGEDPIPRYPVLENQKSKTCQNGYLEVVPGANSFFSKFCWKHKADILSTRVKISLCFSSKFLVIFLQISLCFLQILCIFREISRKKYRKFYEKLRRFDRKFLMTFVAFFGLFRLK